MQMYTMQILLVEDEARLRVLVAKYLKKEGYQVLEAGDGKEALDLWETEKVDAVILDVMLPIYDGWSVCRSIRKKDEDIPIIMLTARGAEEDKIFGFELGVDDYVTKPFSAKELMARVKAVLKRSGKRSINPTIEYYGHKIEPKSYKVYDAAGESLDLSPKEYDLLLYFIDNKNIALTREKILDGVWGYDYFGDFRTVDTHVKRLRKKMGQFGEHITTVRGVGYRFEV